MTDQELDRLLRRALLDAADQEAQTPPETETPLSEGTAAVCGRCCGTRCCGSGCETPTPGAPWPGGRRWCC